jgi:hypothetical protein
LASFGHFFQKLSKIFVSFGHFFKNYAKFLVFFGHFFKNLGKSFGIFWPLFSKIMQNFIQISGHTDPGASAIKLFTVVVKTHNRVET